MFSKPNFYIHIFCRPHHIKTRPNPVGSCVQRGDVVVCTATSPIEILYLTWMFAPTFAHVLDTSGKNAVPQEQTASVEANVKGTIELLRLATTSTNKKTPFFYVSSLSVFPGNGGTVKDDASSYELPLSVLSQLGEGYPPTTF